MYNTHNLKGYLNITWHMYLLTFKRLQKHMKQITSPT